MPLRGDGSSAVIVDDVSKMFRLHFERNQHIKSSILKGRRARYEEFWALDSVSFEVPAGETFGIIGHNGSGKSTLLKCLAKILRPERGTIKVVGSMSALLELGAGFHPELSGRENIFLNASILGLSKSDVIRKFDDIVEFAGLERFIDLPVKSYSSGMYARLGFSVAVNVEPDVLLIDEVLAVGDEAFYRRSAERIADLRSDGRTAVIVSHALGSVRSLCNTVAWLDHGKLVMIGPASVVVDTYTGQSHEDRVETADHHNRWGSGELRVERFEILDRDGVPRLKLRAGEPYVLRIHIAAYATVDQPVVGFEIYQVEGAFLTGTDTRSRNMLIPSFSEAGYVDFGISSLPLNSGMFDISVRISDWSMTHDFDRVERIARFDVVSGDFVDVGLVNAPGSWDLSGIYTGGV